MRPFERDYVNLSLYNAQIKEEMAPLLTLGMFLSSCSGAIMAGQEAGPEVGKSGWRHPEHMEEVEGEILYLPTS